MIIYSKNIIRFVAEIKHVIRDILSKEMHLRVGRDRFYDRQQRASYPIHAVIYNNKSMLGYFDPHFYEMGFHECLMHTSKEQLRNVIRHELAHYITFIHYGEGLQPHGAEFRALCQQMGWGEGVYRASTCLEGNQEISAREESSVLRKVQKLMALVTSSNTHEAEAAMLKSQQLLLKHNIESTFIGKEEDERVFLKRILKQKKENAKMRSIAKLLETFFVSTVYCRAGEFTYLEILGTAVNVEIAEYVANFLHYELDNLWNLAQQHTRLRGIIAKNSFFLGIAKGYCNKIQALKREYSSEVKNALMVIEKQLLDAKAMAYPRLSSNRSCASLCRESSALGEKMGRQLNIQPAISQSSSSSENLIVYQGGKR
jgi:hypothetical protein